MAKVTFGKAISANDYKDNGATVIWGGAADTTGLTPAVTNVPDTVVTTDAGHFTGQRVPNPEGDAAIAAGTDTSGTYKPLSAGTFAIMAAGNYIIKGGNQDQIAGTTVSNLRTPGNVIATYRKYAVRSRSQVRTIIISSWNYATGAATISSDGSTADTVASADGWDTYANYRLADDAASPTLAVPGELCYALGDGPQTDEYQARTHS